MTASHQPRIALLGGFSATCRGEALAIPAPARRLLALAALSPLPLDRERAAVQLWPDLPPERSRGNLRNALWRIRGACPALLDDGADLRLSPAVQVDVHELMRLARGLDNPEEAQRVFFDADPAALLAELLPGWQDDWLAVERERLHSLALHALEQVALRCSEAGRAVEALDAAYLAVRADPLRESANAALIRVHLAQGNRIEALRAYTSFRSRVRDELGIAVEPLPELQRDLAVAFLPDTTANDTLPIDRPDPRQ